MKIPAQIKSMGTATIGQAFNFVAMLLPVVGKEASQLAYLMFPLALSAVLFKLGSFAFHVRYLTLSKDQRNIGTSVSVLGLIFTSLIAAIVGVCLSPFSMHWFLILAWSGALTISHGLYYMAVAVVIVEQRSELYGRIRVAYGTINLLLTVLVVFVFPFRAGLTLVAFLVTFLTGVLMLRFCENNLIVPTRSHFKRSISKVGVSYITESTRATGAILLADIGFQVQGFLTPLMGNLQEIWAVTMRLTGGFSTVGMQIIAPTFEMKVSDAIRTEDTRQAIKWSKYSILAGLTLSILVVPMQLGAILFATDTTSVAPELQMIMVMVSVYALGSLITSVGSKMPFLLGHETGMFLWAIMRISLSLPLLLTHDLGLLTGLALLQMVMALLQVRLSLSLFGRVERKGNNRLRL